MRNRRQFSFRTQHQGLRPQTPSERWQLRKLGLYALGMPVLVGGLFLAKDRVQRQREKDWQSASAYIEDARAVAVGQVESNRGGAMLYNVEVRAKYEADGAIRERWIGVQQLPEALGDAELQVFRRKGKTCLVRWNSMNKEQMIAEVS